MAGPTKDWKAGDLAVAKRGLPCPKPQIEGPIVKGAVYRVLSVKTSRKNGRVYVRLRAGSEGGWSATYFRKIQPASKKFAEQMRSLKPSGKKTEKQKELETTC